ncbi:hypothetical protein [Gaoshiqia sp. Z1-71]|uniref:hypothetical protein n=1 Tax=Gaoshiqia hydrogeniformans TaxID=3290090 RepID=UPI003BF802AC
MLKILKLSFCFLVVMASGIQPGFSQENKDAVNLLLNPYFEFHSFTNHRDGKPEVYSSGNVAFWNTEAWGNIQVTRESHVADSVRPRFSTHNLVAIQPGKKFWQFFTLPEVGLAHGEQLNLSVYGYQPKGDMLKAKIKLLKLDSEDGEWSPVDFGMTDKRTFPKHSRGDLVLAKEYKTASAHQGSVKLQIKGAEIIGKVSVDNKSHSGDVNTIAVQIEFENSDSTETVWVYSPNLTKVGDGLNALPESRKMEPTYRYIPRTIQKLWKGETIHIIVMGSSIDRGSANPPMYLYDENPESETFKQPLSEGLFDADLAGRKDLDGYFGQWRHYFSHAGRLKLELMRKFNLPANKICLNYMACDGSSVGEAHSGLAEYFRLSLPPDPELNGQTKGKTWEELYPGLFSRKEGPAPDLVIFGSGGNEKTDTPDEVAVFEGMIRWIQTHYPNTEFLFGQFMNFGGHTPSPGDLQAIALRYQIPFLDYGKVGDDLVRWCNQYAFVPIDGHPQAAAHFIWFKQFEKAFECWDPIVPGQVQVQLPERIHPNAYGWEGDMVTFDKSSNRIKGNRFIFEDVAVNCWGKVDGDKPVPYVDGVRSTYESRRSYPERDVRNSMFRFGHARLGDRHIIEIVGENAELTYVDAKICPNRRMLTVDNPSWKLPKSKIENFVSEWGAPYGSKKLMLKPGQSIEIEVACTDLSVAYVDLPEGGVLDVYIDNQLKLSQPTNRPFIDADKNASFMENRKGILDLGFGLHKVRLEAKEASVAVLGIFTYDSRSNLDSERRFMGLATGGETLKFPIPFRTRPLVTCSGGLSVKTEDIALTEVKFSGTSGTFEIIGE